VEKYYAKNYFFHLFYFFCAAPPVQRYTSGLTQTASYNLVIRLRQKKNAENIEKKLQKTNVDKASAKMVSSTASKSEKNEDEKLLEQQRHEKLEAAIGKQCKKMKSDIEAIARGDRGSFIDENGKEELVLERDRGKKLEEWKESYRKYGCEKLYPLG
jgi:hypothetical protein